MSSQRCASLPPSSILFLLYSFSSSPFTSSFYPPTSHFLLSRSFLYFYMLTLITSDFLQPAFETNSLFMLLPMPMSNRLSVPMSVRYILFMQDIQFIYNVYVCVYIRV